jgi:hypothetical protein
MPEPAIPLGVYRAINAVQAELVREGIGKSQRNQQQGYNFRGIDQVYNAVSPILARCGLVILPRHLTRTCTERVTAKGNAIFYAVVEAEFDLVATEDGSRHVIRTFGEAMDTADKATNKAMSAAYKYAVMQAFAIPTEGDNDADATTHEVTPSVVAQQLQRSSVIKVAADQAIALFAEGRAVAAYEQVSGIIDPDEKDFLWSLLHPHPALRRKLKELAAADAAPQTT